MKKIIKSITVITGIFMLVSCGEKPVSEQITSLKAQRDEINQKIETLEASLKGDSSLNEDKSAKSIAVQEIKTNTFKHYIEVQGKLDGDENLAVFTKIPGTVEKIYVSSGQQVSTGQILAKLDDAILQKGLQELETSYQFINELFEKQKKLWEQKIGSEVQFLSAKNNKEAMEGRIKSLKEQIEMSLVKSPINGSIEELNLKVGQPTNPMLPAFRIISFNKLKVSAEVAEGYSSKVKAGDDVRVYFPDIDKEADARISFSSRYINAINRTFVVEVSLTQSMPQLKANMVCMLRINDYTKENGISIPMSYILKDPSGYYVFTAKASGESFVASKTPVQLGINFNGVTEIKSGLQAGDKLVTVGHLDLENGQKIKF